MGGVIVVINFDLIKQKTKNKNDSEVRGGSVLLKLGPIIYLYIKHQNNEKDSKYGEC